MTQTTPHISPNICDNSCNEFSAKKIGELLAFLSVEIDTFFAKANQSFVSIHGALKMDTFKEELDAMQSTLLTIAEELEVFDIAKEKQKKTIAKLEAMRELYVKGEWDNPVEMAEWSGFFEGAAIVHWSLLLGVAEAMDNKKLIELSLVAKRFHESLLHVYNKYLHDTAEVKACVKR